MYISKSTKRKGLSIEKRIRLLEDRLTELETTVNCGEQI